MIKTRLPVELLPEIINRLPLNARWAELRVSLVFDLFLLSAQKEAIILKDSYFGVISAGIGRLEALRALVGRTRTIDGLKLLATKLTFIYRASQPVPDRIMANEFKQEYRQIDTTWWNIREDYTIANMRVVVNERITCIINLFDLQIRYRELVLNSTDFDLFPNHNELWDKIIFE
ncbi:unnamed protein product [Meloidogyne enterolobii]|uniref:Uncharacterized protein n=1 Tax=Meloidogyne enterolobii TaxID=390850 RepID=A0ACB1B2Z4_MELEN